MKNNIDKPVYFITDRLNAYGGTPEKIYTLLSGRNNYHDTVLCLNELGNGIEKFNKSNIKIDTLNYGYSRSLKQIWEIYQKLKTLNDIIVVTNFTRALLFGFIPSKLLKHKLVHFEHGIKKSNYKIINILCEVILLLFFDKIFVNSKATAMSYSLYALLKYKIVIIYNGVRVTPQNQNKKRNRKTPLNIISVGSMIELRNHKQQINIAKSLKEKSIKFHWIMIGSGKGFENVKSLIKEYKLEDKISLLGNISRDDVLSNLNNSDVFISTTINEGFGSAVVEAMAYQNIVIAYSSGSMPEIITHQKDGYLFKPNDYTGVVNIIEEIYNNKIEYEYLITNQKNKIKNFTEDVFLEFFNNRINEL